MIAVLFGCLWLCGFYSQLRASFTYFGPLLHRTQMHCQYMKVNIKRNTIQVELIRFRKNSDFIDVLITIRDELPLVCLAPGAPDVSEHSHIGT